MIRRRPPRREVWSYHHPSSKPGRHNSPLDTVSRESFREVISVSGFGYCAVYPPSTMMSWPVVNAALGELSQSTALAISDYGKLAGDVNRRAGKADVAGGGGVIDDGTTAGTKHGRDFMLHREQQATDVDVADLMVMLDRLLGGERAELALGAGIVERDMQSPEGADSLCDERDDVILSGDIGLHEQGASTGPK